MHGFDIPAEVTCLMPWDGKHREWFDEAVASLPDGMRLLLVQNSNPHDMCAGLNAAIEDVKTPFVWLMAADDLASDDLLQELRACIGTADVAYPSMELFGKVEGEFVADMPSRWRVQDSNICGVFLARTEVLRRFGWEFSPCEDWTLVHKMIAAGVRFVSVPRAKYRYRTHSDSHGHRMVEVAAKAGIDWEGFRSICTQQDRERLVATFYCDQNEATSYVRCLLPARYLPASARVTFDEKGEHQSPAAIFQYPTGETRKWIDACRARGQAFLIEVDDNYVSNQLVRTLRYQARWAQGMSQSADAWQRLQPSHKQLVREADGVICSTLPLADAYSDYNDNVHVILNSVDPADWPAAPHPHRLDSTLRIGWAAGTQHGPDAPLVESALRWASKQPGVQVVIVGVNPEWDFSYQWEPATRSGQVYRDSLSLFDIGLAPVRDSDMNRSKSDLKFLEYTMAGVPTIASLAPAYEHTIRHGETGLLCKNASEFKTAIRDLVANEDERYRLTQNAATYVAEHRLAPMMRPAYLAAVASTGAIKPPPPNRATRRAESKNKKEART